MIHIVLFEPEIPPNTGNIIRLCANTGAQLHIIEPMAFEWDDKRLRRAGLDYREFVDVQRHQHFEAFLQAVPNQRIFAFSSHAKKYYTDIAFADGDCLLFGSETKGLPLAVKQHAAINDLLTLPMLAGNRSLNLSNSAAIATYEAWRQLQFSTTGKPPC